MKRARGFTLIELLVVIAIIALLLSILMPSLQKVKKQAQTVVGRSNHKQLYLSFGMYAEDNDNKIWKGFWDNSYAACTPFVGHNWWMPALTTYAGEIPKIRFCPAAKKLRWQEDGTTPGLGNGKEPFCAWGYNNWLDQNTPEDKKGTCHFGSYAVNGWIEDSWNDCLNSAPNYWRRSNKISQAEAVPFLTDGQWIDCWPRDTEPPPSGENVNWQTEGSHFVRIVQNRHHKAQNVIFMDGSARIVGLKELWTLKWHRNYNTNGMYTKAGGSNESSWPEWMQGFEDF